MFSVKLLEKGVWFQFASRCIEPNTVLFGVWFQFVSRGMNPEYSSIWELEWYLIDRQLQNISKILNNVK